MIAYLEGKLAFKSPTHVFLDIGGIAYHVNIGLHTYSKIESLDKVKLHTQLLVKEDSHTLYGFFDVVEKELFNLLISVSGIGGNTARVILSYMSPHEVKTSILHDNYNAFNKVKGIGPKTAKRIILDLKDKIAKIEIDSSGEMVDFGAPSVKDEALEALKALGFQKARIEQKINGIIANKSGDLTVEVIIKEVLKQLS